MTISTNLVLGADVGRPGRGIDRGIAPGNRPRRRRLCDPQQSGGPALALGDRTGYGPGQLDEAIAELRIATALNPDLEDAFVNLALALLKAGQPDAAIAECRAALAINSRSDRALYGMATILMSLGRPADARQFIERASPRTRTRPRRITPMG